MNLFTNEKQTHRLREWTYGCLGKGCEEGIVRECGMDMCLYACSVAQLCLTLCDPMTVAPQDPLSMGFSRQEHGSGLPYLSPEALPHPRIKPASPALQASLLKSKSQFALSFPFLAVGQTKEFNEQLTYSPHDWVTVVRTTAKPPPQQCLCNQSTELPRIKSATELSGLCHTEGESQN